MRQVITIETASLGDRSYIAHDGVVALVVDPQRDIDRLLAATEAAGLTITQVAETHVHNDYVTGGLVLARMTGAEYVHASAEALSFDCSRVEDGDLFSVGTLTVEVVSTPGHTPHHLSYVVHSEGQPPAIFTGGSLLYGTVGRTDLIGADATERLARLQFKSAHRLASMLPAETEVYPTHGFGSFCASTKSEGHSDGTLGTERRVNVALTIDNEDDFVHRLVSDLTAYPSYYAHMGLLNQSGPGAVDLSPPAPVDPVELARRIHRGEWVVDIRSRRAFAADHIAGTVGIELADPFSTYLGWLIPWGMPVTLLGDSIDQIAEAQRQLVRIGIDRPAGAASGGMAVWGSAGDHRSYRVEDYAALAQAMAAPDVDINVVDVRGLDERAEDHIAGSTNLPIQDLMDRLSEIPDGEVWVHCASGLRASIAAGLLERAGHRVVLIEDHFENAAKAGLSMTGATVPVQLGAN